MPHHTLLSVQTRSSTAATAKPPASFSLEHMEQFRNKVNMMTTDMPYAVVSTSADPPLHRPDVVMLVPTCSGPLPPRRDLLNALRGLVQGGKLGKHSGYRMEEIAHPSADAVKAQALYFYNMEDGSPFPGLVVRCCDAQCHACRPRSDCSFRFITPPQIGPQTASLWPL